MITFRFVFKGGRSTACFHGCKVLTKNEMRLYISENWLNKFNDENIKIKSFFAPNHTFDKNTLLALRKCGINEVIDGYGLMPYEENKINFIPQLFYKIYRY